MKDLRWLPLAALALTSAFSIAVAGVPGFHGPESKLSAKSEAALKRLESQLQRRFSEVDNIDFGYARIIRPDARMHVGPTTLKYGDPKKSPRRVVLKFPGADAVNLHVRTLMYAENDAEAKAIHDLNQELGGVAIYTYGLFDLGKMEIRAKGPAYLSKTSDAAPKASELTSRVNAVWRSGADTADVLAENGWTLHIRKVKASVAQCITCHRKVYEQGSQLKEAPKAIGDGIGLVVIATRPKAKTDAGTLH